MRWIWFALGATVVLILVNLAGMRIRRMAQAGNQRFAIAMTLLAFGGFSLATIPPVTAGTPQWSLAFHLASRERRWQSIMFGPLWQPPPGPPNRNHPGQRTDED